MEIRRPIAALLTALALVGGGASMTACASPSGGSNSDQRNDGTNDTSHNTAGNDPGGASQNNLPDNSNRQTGSDSGDQQDKGQP
jgi:hypothetical protein